MYHCISPTLFLSEDLGTKVFSCRKAPTLPLRLPLAHQQRDRVQIALLVEPPLSHVFPTHKSHPPPSHVSPAPKAHPHKSSLPIAQHR